MLVLWCHVLITLTGPAPWAQGSRVWGAADPAEHRDPLTDRSVEVVVVGDGGDPEAGVVLGRGVGPISVSGVLGGAGLALVRQFGRFFIFTMYTAHDRDSTNTHLLGDKRTTRKKQSQQSCQISVV